ncbi:LysE/ArgO family amino acid transporter [Desulfobaculum bizertense]|uniref:L-lysine exporter family protein LysE/ArgO n=1 Tax=Desulfobaculum bizertense DSM 18034 TaxID=1121442 RepID=A0A1T4W228_9BACT|nr:LysE/ArgO family amino acid transporter [Desulfobaculum bizertense]SKA71108.1 L-lysine exporter family protein LysE/ArgO [Desulfobaculum bizertense DSM 18034]
MLISPFIQGIGTGAGLIIAIGAQNAFVLSQGLQKNYPLQIATFCILADALLISLGISGLGTLITQHQGLASFAAWGGALFLFWYGLGSFRAAFSDKTLVATEDSRQSLKVVLLTASAVTFLNPQAYLDTVVLLGSIGGQFPGDGRYLFGAGALTASTVWFLSLSFGARLLRPFFQSARSWKVLDLTTCAIMWSIGGSLVYKQVALF